MTHEAESIRFENYLLFSLFLAHFSRISNRNVTLLIIKNKTNCMKALCNIHPENFDNNCELGVCKDQLEQFLGELSAGI